MKTLIIVLIVCCIVFVALFIITHCVPGLLLNLDTSTPTTSADRLFSPEFCEQLVKTCNGMEKTVHNSVLRTIGQASYIELDAKQLKKNNEMLLEAFPEIYPAIINHFKQLYPDWNVKYRSTAPLPGMHIFKSSKIFTYPVASLHVDRQYTNVDFRKDEQPDYSGTLSFTIPIQIPPGGTGLHLWKGSGSSDTPWWTLGLRNLTALWLRSRPHSYYEYECGKIVVHSGNDFHIISPTKKASDTDRITIQGHGVYCKKDNTLYLYW